jgi:TonB-linked SusC/RagA family outer membrane protein
LLNDACEPFRRINAFLNFKIKSSMRKIALLLSLLVLSVLAFAQQRTVSGTVRDDKGDPIPFATITEVGKNNTTQADANGAFTLKVAQNAQLRVTATGHSPQTVSVTGNTVTVALSTVEAQLSEVVVTTAFGVKRSQRITPYSAQTVNREQLAIIPQTNVNSALAGKVAGAQFRGQSPIKLNDQGSLRLRGGLSLSDVGALYVVDGTPVNSFDINPDDIESVTVLKGANATALLGERARGGAVLITTRKRGDKNTAGIEVNQGITFDKVYILPKYQNLYAGGASSDLTKFTWTPGMPAEWQALNGAYFHDMTDDASWGPRMVGQQHAPWYAWIPGTSDFGKTVPLLPQPNNMRDFWNTGVTSTTNVSFSKAGQGFNTRISYTNNSIRGMLPNSRSQKHNLFTTASVDLSSRFTLAANVNYVNNSIIGVFDDGYSNQSAGGFNQWFHRDLDIKKIEQYRRLKTPINTYASWNMTSNPSAGSTDSYVGNYWYNFYTYFDQVNNRQIRDRLFGDASLTYNINKNFKLRGVVRKNAINTYYENILPTELELSASQTGELASYSTGQTRSNEMNYEGLASYTSQFLDNKLNVNMNAGGNVLQTRYRDVTQATSQGLNVPGLYAITNSKANPTVGNRREGSEVRSLFGFGDIEWNRMVAVNFAVRNDWYSTLPAGNNSLLSPSVGASFFFSDLTKNALPWLSYGKVFGSWGKKPTSLDIYQNNFAYTINQDQWNGSFLTTAPNTLIEPGVSGALITTYEAGLEFRFARNRYGLNLTYFDEKQEDAPLSIPISGVSGYTTQLVNASRVARKGIEVIADARIMTSRDFEWTVNKTFGYLISNPVQELLPGQDRILLAGGSFGTRFARAFQEVNYDWGQLIGGGIKRNEAGLPLIDESMTGGALYVADVDRHWGSVVPKMTGGLVNTLTYKGLTLNFNIDYQFGGKFFSLSEMWGHFSGLLEATAATNDKGMNVRDAVVDGGGVHVVGVSAADGKTPVDIYVPAQEYYHSFYYSQIAEPFVHSLSFVKLREVSLGYRVPTGKLGKVGNVIKGATVSVVARNPVLLYRETQNFDPSEISAIQGEDGNMPGTRSIGVNFKFNF